MEETSRRAPGPRSTEESSGSRWWMRVGRSLLGAPLSFISPRQHSDRTSLPQASRSGEVVKPTSSTTAEKEEDRQDMMDRGSGAALARQQPETSAITSRGYVVGERREPLNNEQCAARWQGGAVERAALERQLHSELPLVWMFLREREGWSFVNQKSWDVCRPRRGNETDVMNPLPQSQLPSYIMAHPRLLCRYQHWRREKSIRIARAVSDDSDSDVGTVPSEADPISPTRPQHDRQPQPEHGESSLPVGATASAASPPQSASTKSPVSHRNRNSSSPTPSPPRPASKAPRSKQPGVLSVHELASSPAAAAATETSEVLPFAATGVTTNAAPEFTGGRSAVAAYVAGFASAETIPSTSGTASTATPAATADMDVDLNAENNPEVQQPSTIQENPAAAGAGLAPPPGEASISPPTATMDIDDDLNTKSVLGERIKDGSINPASSTDMDQRAAEVVSPGETSGDIVASDNSGLLSRGKRRQHELSTISSTVSDTDPDHENPKRRWRFGGEDPVDVAPTADSAREADPVPDHESSGQRGAAHVVEASPPACRTRSRFSPRPSLPLDAIDALRWRAGIDTGREDEKGEATSNAGSSSHSSASRVSSGVSSVGEASVADGETGHSDRNGGPRTAKMTSRSATQRRRGASDTRGRTPSRNAAGSRCAGESSEVAARTPNRKAAGSRRAGESSEVAARTPNRKAAGSRRAGESSEVAAKTPNRKAAGSRRAEDAGEVAARTPNRKASRRAGESSEVAARTPNRKASRRAGESGGVAAPEGAGSAHSTWRGKRRASAEEEESQAPPTKMTKVKIEGEKAIGRRSQRPERQESGHDGASENGDPFAPYAKIERETVSDEGLEELLHNSRGKGYLDIRRYRKPGFPRPMRTTRIEANHGKSFHEHLMGLLKDGKRVQATVLLRQLEHFDNVPPDLAASLSGVACVPAWYQALAAGPDGVEIEEVFDLTAKESEVIDCEEETLDCVMWDIVKKEPGVSESGVEDQDGSGSGGSGAGTATPAGGSGSDATAAFVKQEMA